MSRSRRLVLILIAVLAVFSAIQLVPYGHDRSAPRDGLQVAWNSPQTEELAKRACFDCHSNQTRWPWYASIAPMSWRIQSHVQEGREALNFTAFEPLNEDVAEAAGEASESVSEGEMPPRDYLLAHPEARLSKAERQTLIQGLDQTFASFAEHENHASSGGSGAIAHTDSDDEGDDADDDE